MRRAPIFETAEAAEEAFYDAMQRGDVIGMMSLWADDDDAICIHPGGPRLVGRRAIEISWQEILADGGMDIRPSAIHVIAGPVISVHNVVEELGVEGEPGIQTVSCLATNVYVKDGGGWKLLVHHAGPARDDLPTPGPGDTLH